MPPRLSSTQVSLPSQGASLVVAGYACGFAALLVLPSAFGLAALTIGVINLSKGKVGHGIAQIVLAVSCGIAGSYYGAYIWQRNAQHSLSPRPADSITVFYEIDGTAPGNVLLTYTNASGGMEQQTKKLYWFTDLKVARGTSLYLSAQNQDARGTIKAKIFANGIVVQEAETATPYGIASVSGVIDPPADTQFEEMSPADHLASARRLDADGRITLAFWHLNAIPVTAPEYVQAQAALKESVDTLVQRTDDARGRFAYGLEEQLSEQGYAVTARAQNKRLILTGTLSVAIQHFMASMATATALCKFGFEEIQINNRTILLDCAAGRGQ